MITHYSIFYCTHNQLCATVDSQCLEYLGYISLTHISLIMSSCYFFLHLGNTNYYTTNTNFASDDVYVMDASNYYYYRVQVSIESVDHGTSEWSDELIVLTREMEENFPWYSGTNQELEDLKVLIVR